MFFLQVVCAVVFVYGLLSLVQDIINEFTYKRICHDMKIVIFAKNLEKKIEQFIIELNQMKRVNCYKHFTIVDLEEDDDIQKIQTRLYNSEINGEVLNVKEGKEYAIHLLQNEK